MCFYLFAILKLTEFKNMKINIRKILNLPNNNQSIVINEGCEKLLKMAEEKSTINYKNEYDREKKHNSICPNCGGTDIVNKITRVEGNVSGSFIWGNGGIYGHTDTNDVNNCNKCGNQWKKYEKNYKWKDDIIASWLDDLNTVYENKYNFGNATVELLKDIPAESIWKEGQKIAHKCYSSTRENISLSYLRTKFKTVYQ